MHSYHIIYFPAILDVAVVGGILNLLNSFSTIFLSCLLIAGLVIGSFDDVAEGPVVVVFFESRFWKKLARTSFWLFGFWLWFGFWLDAGPFVGGTVVFPFGITVSVPDDGKGFLDWGLCWNLNYWLIKFQNQFKFAK